MVRGYARSLRFAVITAASTNGCKPIGSQLTENYLKQLALITAVIKVMAALVIAECPCDRNSMHHGQVG